MFLQYIESEITLVSVMYLKFTFAIQYFFYTSQLIAWCNLAFPDYLSPSHQTPPGA